jgi:hypothetical protein
MDKGFGPGFKAVAENIISSPVLNALPDVLKVGAVVFSLEDFKYGKRVSLVEGFRDFDNLQACSQRARTYCTSKC